MGNVALTEGQSLAVAGRHSIQLNALHKTMDLPRKQIPPMAMVEQRLPSANIPDVRRDVREKLIAAGLRDKVKPGAHIAITAGSRGLAALCDLLLGIADAIREAHGKPFIVPAMGSHGGGTAEGQAEILRSLGVSEETLGIPVRATMDTVELGRAENGAMAHLDCHAADADGIIVLGRVKTHPESAAELASGLLKMTVIGLGKQRGAIEAHTHELWPSVRAIPKIVLQQATVLFGVAMVENAYDHPAVIEVVPPTYDAFLEADIRLLRIAKENLARIPFQHLDVLVMDEIGKTVSGSGMDLNIVGHWRGSGGPHIPDFKRIVVLSLTPESLGNGIGIGFADFTTERFARDYDPRVTYVNLLTATEPGNHPREGNLPMPLESDKEAIEVALFSALGGDKPRMSRIKNTRKLDQFWVSESLLEEVRNNPKLSILSGLESMQFDDAGNLF